MIYKNIPKNFNPIFEGVGVFCEHNNSFVLLHRQSQKPEGNQWGIPSGKIKNKEKPLMAAKRELEEETGLNIPFGSINYFNKVYVKFPNYDFIYYMFHTVLDERKDIRINPEEHKDFKWTSPEDALKMNLIQDLDNCIKLYYKIS